MRQPAHASNEAARDEMSDLLTADSMWTWPYIHMEAVTGCAMRAARVQSCLAVAAVEAEARGDVAPATALPKHTTRTRGGPAAAEVEEEDDSSVGSAESDAVVQRTPAILAIEAHVTAVSCTWLATALAALHTNSTMASELVVHEAAALARDALVPAAASVAPAWRPYVQWLSECASTAFARHLTTRSCPPHLLAQLESYLPPLSEVVKVLLPRGVDDGEGASPLHPELLHSDVTGDNIVGDFHFAPADAPGDASLADSNALRAWLAACHAQGEDAAAAGALPVAPGLHWVPHTLLDFADARMGDPMYDVIAIYCSVLLCDKRSLHTFIGQYHAARGACRSAQVHVATLPTAMTEEALHRAMCLLLIHPVDGVSVVRTTHPGLLESCASWQAVAHALFGPN
ncbi:MAG: hypothetical protein EOO41_02385 [Methanobacteriota archaeon]|nr:MAG: hypothetical protein EOO41_02385 [Euryarchaeota archaeon]